MPVPLLRSMERSEVFTFSSCLCFGDGILSMGAKVGVDIDMDIISADAILDF